MCDVGLCLVCAHSCEWTELVYSRGPQLNTLLGRRPCGLVICGVQGVAFSGLCVDFCQNFSISCILLRVFFQTDSRLPPNCFRLSRMFLAVFWTFRLDFFCTSPDGCGFVLGVLFFWTLSVYFCIVPDLVQTCCMFSSLFLAFVQTF